MDDFCFAVASDTCTVLKLWIEAIVQLQNQKIKNNVYHRHQAFDIVADMLLALDIWGVRGVTK